MKVLFLILCLIGIPHLALLYGMDRSPNGRPRTSRGIDMPPLSPRERQNSDTRRIMRTTPLAYALNISVETFFTRGDDRHYDTLVIDRDATTFRTRQLQGQRSQSMTQAVIAHEALEDWCASFFPEHPAEIVLPEPPTYQQHRAETFNVEDEKRPSPQQVPRSVTQGTYRYLSTPVIELENRVLYVGEDVHPLPPAEQEQDFR
jgi:hypothetical protein